MESDIWVAISGCLLFIHFSTKKFPENSLILDIFIEIPDKIIMFLQCKFKINLIIV